MTTFEITKHTGTFTTKSFEHVTAGGVFLLSQELFWKPLFDNSPFLQIGQKATVTFTPSPTLIDYLSVNGVPSPVIGIIQCVRSDRWEREGENFNDVPQQEQYEDEPTMTLRTTQGNWKIDQSTYVKPNGSQLTEGEAVKLAKNGELVLPQTNPVFCSASKQVMSDVTIAASLTDALWPKESTYGHVCAHGEPTATLIDEPSRITYGEERFKHTFEVAAVLLNGTDKNKTMYLGSFRYLYGWIADDEAPGKNPKGVKLSYARGKPSEDVPSEDFLEAARLWNAMKVGYLGNNGEIAKPVPPVAIHPPHGPGELKQALSKHKPTVTVGSEPPLKIDNVD